MENKESNGILIPFAQDADFFHRCACRHIDEGDILLAAQYARKAYHMDSSDPEYTLTLAEVLNRMHRYEDSIQVLLLSNPSAELSSESLFGLASDYMGLEEFEAAGKCAELCIEREPDGPYADRAADLIDLLEDQEDLEIQIGLDEGEDIRLLSCIRAAKVMHFSGDDQKAVQFLEGLSEQYAESDILDMEIATALFASSEYEAAEHRLFRIFKRNSKHIRANLLMALLYHAEGRHDEAKEQLDRTIIDPDASPEELGYAGAVFIELGEIERAQNALERLREFLPYDKEMLHQLAYCYLRNGDRKKAEEAYHILVLSDEDDSVAAYYEEMIRKQPEEEFLKAWPLNYDVPVGELVLRQRRLQEVAQGGIEAIRSVYQRDPAFRDLLRWALFSPMIAYRKPVIRMVAVCGGKDTEFLLRKCLIAYNLGDEDKQFAFGSLLSMEAKPPFALYMGGVWQYGAVQPLSVPDKLPRSYSYILWNIQQAKHKAETVAPNEAGLISDRVLEVGVRIFLFYTATLGRKYPKLTPAQEDAMAAAFVLLALSSLDQTEISPDMLCNWYGISKRRLENALQRVFRQLQKEKDL